jgi:long-chain fatty acid transport protein
MKKILIVMSLSTMSAFTYAAGYKVGLQGIKQIGMAHAGTGLALDASSIFFNPGALSYSPNQVILGGTLLMPRVQYLDNSTQTITNADPGTGTPFALYGSYGISKKLVAGLGIYTPFGSTLAYPKGWTGAQTLRSISLKAVFIQPTISYKLNKDLSIGAGFIYSTGSVNLQRDILALQNQNGTYPSTVLDAKASGMGFNAGVYYQKNKLSAGLAYRSNVNMDADNGNATFNDIPASAAANFVNTTFKTSLPLPAELNLGLGYKLNSKTTIAADLNYAFWSKYDSLRFDFTTNTPAVKDVADPRLFKNALAVRLGANYMLNKKVDVRGGVFYDQSPSQDGYVTPETPDNNRLGFTLGTSYKITRDLGVDAAFLYQNVAARTQKNLVSNLDGTFATKALGISIGFSYAFNNKNNAASKTQQKAANSNK